MIKEEKDKVTSGSNKLDDVLRRMLSTPPQTQKPKNKTKKTDKQL